MAFFNQAVETLPRERLRTLQLEKLQRLLSQIHGRNRFYTAKWSAAGVTPGDIRSLDDLARLPLTTKAELARAQNAAEPFGTNATLPESAYTRFHQTSGTTGVPLRVLDTLESWEWWAECWAYVFAAAGVGAGDRVFLAFSFAPFIGFWAAVEGVRRIGAMMIPGGGWDSAQRLAMMRDLRATVLCCTPTYALRLAGVARESGFDLRSIPIRTLVHAGEPGASIPRTKARIEALWGAPCFDHAGASEVGAYSFECECRKGGTHVIESEFIVEVLDPATGQQTPAGAAGELVITNLGRLGFPVVRYRTGDMVRLDTALCPCGRTFTRFDGGLLGRCDDMVIIRGVNVYPGAVENIIRQFDAIEEFQVIVTIHQEMQELEIRIETTPEDALRTRAAVEEAIYRAMSLRSRVIAVDEGALPRPEMKSSRWRIQN